MPDRYFLDTNIFVYTFDRASAAKRSKARGIVQQALVDKAGVVSYQVIQEFLNLATRRFESPLPPHDCLLYLDQVLVPLWEVHPTRELYRKSLAVMDETGYSFYDSLIVAGAILAGCGILYTEDLQDGRKIEGIAIRNPFR